VLFWSPTSILGGNHQYCFLVNVVLDGSKVLAGIHGLQGESAWNFSAILPWPFHAALKINRERSFLLHMFLGFTTAKYQPLD
jgi:hypothetical protein